MFKKRKPETLSDRKRSLDPLNAIDKPKFDNRVLLDYVISRVSGDQRPYLEVTVLNYPILGLLDSGASRTLVGPRGYEILLQLGLKLVPHHVECTVASGDKCFSLGYITVPFCLENKIKLIDVLVLPDIPHSLILGVDFWVSMEIIPDLRQNIWNFSGNDPSVNINSISDASSLTSTQQFALS